MKTSRFRSFSRRYHAFTLVELLVSMTVLMLLVVLFAQATGVISNAWQSAQERMDNYTKARALLNRLQIDIDSMVVRPDLAIFPDNNGTPTFAFFTLRKGSSSGASRNQEDTRILSYVTYTFHDRGDNQSGLQLPGGLVRSDRSYTFTDNLLENFADASKVVTTPTPTVTPTPFPTPEAESNLVMAEGVLSFTWAFLRHDGLYSPTYYYLDTKGNLRAALGVAVALLVINDRSALNLSEMNGGKLTSLLAALTVRPPASGGDRNWNPKGEWEEKLGLRITSHRASVAHRYPGRFLRSIRAFQRVYVFPSGGL